MIPEITVNDLSEKLKSGDSFILLDVREPMELELAEITDNRVEVTPMSRLANEGLNALPDNVKDQDVVIYVLCHHGNRSGQVTAWLAQQGWKNVFSVQGGLDEYARRVDQSVGFY